MIKVLVEKITGRKMVKRAMLATAGITKLSKPELFEKKMKSKLSKKTFQDLMRACHSPLNEYVFWVDAIVSERVHTHIVRHSRKSDYVATSRPDIDYAIPLKDDERILSIKIPLDRVNDIMRVRLCGASWNATQRLFWEIRKQIIEIDPPIETFMVPNCVWYGFCNQNKDCCTYIHSKKYPQQRCDIIGNSRKPL